MAPSERSESHDKASHVRLYHLARSVLWLVVTVGIFVGIFLAIDRYAFNPSESALVGFTVGLWMHKPLLKYGNHLIAAITGDSINAK